jgi:hypothetical protein
LPILLSCIFIPLVANGEAMMNSKILAIVSGSAHALCACIGLLAAGSVTAAVVSPSASVTVTQSYSYTTYNGGDFVFSTSAAAPGCGAGWYISSSDPGYKAAVASVLTAQAAGNFVLVYGDNAVLWSGSTTGQYCHVQAVGITS